MKRLLPISIPVLMLAALNSCSSDTGEDANVYMPTTSTTGPVTSSTGSTPVSPVTGPTATGPGPAPTVVNPAVTPPPVAGTGGEGPGPMPTGPGPTPTTAPTTAPTTPVVEPPVCGDGEMEGTEQCDDGNAVDGDGCEANCTTTPAADCGDGAVNEGEECDDGNDVDGDGCESNCIETPPEPVCGDGNVDEGEACDDMNDVPGDGCEADCTATPAPEPVCGDGTVDPGEACDDGNDVAADGCEPVTCTVTPDAPVDLMSLASELHGHTIIMPCGQFTSTEVCTPENIGMMVQGDPGLQGQISHYAEITFGGEAGTFYDVTVRVRGLVESKRYNNGVDRDGSGSQDPADGLYTGGTPDNGTNGYNVYRLRTESPQQDYYLNSCNVGNDARMYHGVFDTDFIFTFQVEGGSTIILSSADPNNSAIANCGTDQDDQCPPTSLQNLDPLIADDIGSQPFDGQFIGFVVQEVTLAQ